MHVFIDSNTYLNLYGAAPEDLETLKKVFVLQTHGKIELWTDDHLLDEIQRNREAKLRSFIVDFDRSALPVPGWLKGYVPEFAEYRAAVADVSLKKQALLRAFVHDAEKRRLTADRLLTDIFDRSNCVCLLDELAPKAERRVALGKPPGKKQSIGDAIHWISLLEKVPFGQDLIVVTDDGDFCAPGSNQILSYLEWEWRNWKGPTTKVTVFSTLEGFLSKNFGGASLATHFEVELLSKDLRSAADIHQAAQALWKLQESFPEFSEEQAASIADAFIANPLATKAVNEHALDAIRVRVLAKSKLTNTQRDAVSGLRPLS